MRTSNASLNVRRLGSNQTSNAVRTKNAYARKMVHSYDMPCITRTRPTRILSMSALRVKRSMAGTSCWVFGTEKGLVLGLGFAPLLLGWWGPDILILSHILKSVRMSDPSGSRGQSMHRLSRRDLGTALEPRSTPKTGHRSTPQNRP